MTRKVGNQLRQAKFANPDGLLHTGYSVILPYTVDGLNPGVTS